jgi:hypothetical protein
MVTEHFLSTFRLLTDLRYESRKLTQLLLQVDTKYERTILFSYVII